MAVSLDDWVAIVIGGLVVLIALDLALVVAISDPFRGSLRVVPSPIEDVLHELEAGRFGSVAAGVETPDRPVQQRSSGDVPVPGRQVDEGGIR